YPGPPTSGRLDAGAPSYPCGATLRLNAAVPLLVAGSSVQLPPLELFLKVRTAAALLDVRPGVPAQGLRHRRPRDAVLRSEGGDRPLPASVAQANLVGLARLANLRRGQLRGVVLRA